jgi:predicted DNA binding CopG/RHH family protein
MKIKLDAYEKEIEKNIDTFVPVTGKKRKKIEALIKKSKEERKSKNINIRISEHDLYNLRVRSAEEGIPYQTLITSVLHKYLANRLVDEEQVIQTLRRLRKR